MLMNLLRFEPLSRRGRGWGEGSVSRRCSRSLRSLPLSVAARRGPRSAGSASPAIPMACPGGVNAFAVLRTIQLHDQLLGYAAEIRDVRRNRMLAAEFQTTQLPGTQTLPELPLRIGHV